MKGAYDQGVQKEREEIYNLGDWETFGRLDKFKTAPIIIRQIL
jgi:hypothetical protein